MKRKAKNPKRRKRPVGKATRSPRKKAVPRSTRKVTGYTPRVVIKFHDKVVLPYDDGVDQALERMPDGTWRRLKQQFSGISIRILVKSITPRRIRELVAEARRQNDAYQPPNFLTYYVINVPEKVDPNELVKSLVSWGIVETAYFDPPGRDPHRVVRNPPLLFEDPLMSKQGYLGPSEVGIDAHFAWGQPGGQGEGTRIIDLEQGWTLDHEDLKAHGAQQLHGTLRDVSRPHGTKVLGIVCAVRNHLLCRGIAPKVASVNVMSYSGDFNSVPEVIATAVDKLQHGDVLLLEVERPAENTDEPFFPTEFFQADFDYIQLATTKGITVVEAAGNSSLDLESLRDPAGNRVLARGARDSGAILVAAATSGNPHARMQFSNFGTRVDCYAWGENVVTLTSTQFAPFGTKGHTELFGGTSSAAAIIAGAALVVQGVAIARTGARLNALQMRSLLRDPTLSTKSADPANDHIGVMPDLRKIISGNAIDRMLPVVAPPGR